MIFEAVDGHEALARSRARGSTWSSSTSTCPVWAGWSCCAAWSTTGKVKVLVLSMHAEPLYAARALDAGAAGYVSKNATPDELLAAVQRVGAGGRYVENEIAQALALQVGAPGARWAS